MSQENVEIVRRIYEAWAQGDFRARIGDLDQHVVLVIRSDFPEFGVFLGHDGVRDYMRRFLEQWEQLTIEATRPPHRRGHRLGPSRPARQGQSKRDRRRQSRTSSSSPSGAKDRADGERHGRGAKPSKPWACRSKTLTPTPEPAGYCAGDVAGERGAPLSSD